MALTLGIMNDGLRGSYESTKTYERYEIFVRNSCLPRTESNSGAWGFIIHVHLLHTNQSTYYLLTTNLPPDAYFFAQFCVRSANSLALFKLENVNIMRLCGVIHI